MIVTFDQYLLLEKSSLTKYGIPKPVMQSIQSEFAIADNVELNKIDFKGDVLDLLKDGKKHLFIQIAIDNIMVFVSHRTIKGIEYFVDKYYYYTDGWGGEFEKKDREYKSFKQLSFDIEAKTNIYELIGDFEVKPKSERNLEKKQKDFNEFNEQFKKDFIQNYDRLLKRITGKHFNSANERIKAKAKMVAYQNDMIIKNLENPLQGQNGLNILDEFLMKFEDEYTQFFKEHLDIQELCDYFTREKTLTMFMYYVYTGKLMK